MHEAMKRSFYVRFGKRALDIAMAALGLILLTPLFAVLAILVKCTSRGPVLFRQRRVGRRGEPFLIAKFRSMADGSDRAGLPITAADDCRMTAVGRVLRGLKLDELPQLWNVLCGDMSIVGPRPEVPRYVNLYSDSERQVLSVRPGITDPASIRYRSEERVLRGHSDVDRYYREVLLPDKLKLNLEYINRISFFYDLSLLVQTTRAVLFGRAHKPERLPVYRK